MFLEKLAPYNIPLLIAGMAIISYVAVSVLKKDKPKPTESGEEKK